MEEFPFRHSYETKEQAIQRAKNELKIELDDDFVRNNPNYKRIIEDEYDRKIQIIEDES